MKHLHAILTTNCNLRCPHCGVPDNVEIYNEEKVLEEIKNFDGEVTLFGGECTLYEDRFIKALETKNVRSVSTNMMDISGKRLELFRGKGFATSCIGCKYAQICTPCRLQKHCTFPKNYMK